MSELGANVRGRVERLCARWGLGDDVGKRIEAFLELLAVDGRAPTAVREPPRAVEAHVADALEGLAVDALRGARQIVDIGAGAGVPGLILAAALPTARVHLLESNARKCAFLERAAAAMDLANAEVVATRAESWADGLGSCDAATARALAPLAVVVEYAAPLLEPGGVLVAWKAAPDRAEERAGAAAASALAMAPAARVAVAPSSSAERRSLYVYSKRGATPSGYPRRPGMARKRPLGA